MSLGQFDVNHVCFNRGGEDLEVLGGGTGSDGTIGVEGRAVARAGKFTGIAFPFNGAALVGAETVNGDQGIALIGITDDGNFFAIKVFVGEKAGFV